MGEGIGGTRGSAKFVKAELTTNRGASAARKPSEPIHWVLVRWAWASLASVALAFAQQNAGVMATIAGATAWNGEPARGFGGDDGHGRKALLALANSQNDCDPARNEQISHLAADAAGNVYVTDSANQRIRRIDAFGTITTVAGNGEKPPVDPRTCVPSGGAILGDGGPARDARLHYPAGIAVHQSGGIVFADQQNNRIRFVNADGVISTLAGNGLHAFYAPQVPALNSGLDWPVAVAVDESGAVYFSELHSGRVARIGADGRLVTVAGTGFSGFNGDSGRATSMRLSNPTGIALDRAGNLYIADQGNHRIRKVTSDGQMTTIAGRASGFEGDGGPASDALMDRPADVKVDAAGNVYISDMGNHRVRRIDASGVIDTIAGDGLPVRGPDGVPSRSSSLTHPTGLAIDPAGDVLVVDWGNYVVRRIVFSGAPVIKSDGLQNSASYAQPVAKGSLFTLYGENLAAGELKAEEAPWPAELGGTRVFVNGQAAPLGLVSGRQINAQLPYSIDAGEAVVEVVTEKGRSGVEFLTAAEAAIGIFVYSGSRRAIALNQDGSVNGAENAEGRGRAVKVLVTGIGPVSPEIASGEAAPPDVDHRAAVDASAMLGGIDATVLYLGLVPGFVGLAHAEVLIPEDAPAAVEVELVIRTGDVSSNVAVVSIQ